MKLLRTILGSTLMKWFIIPLVLILLWFAAAIIVNPYSPFTTIVYRHPVANFIEYQEGMFFKGQQIKGIFVAGEDNLGIISIHINGGVSTNPEDQESVRFTLQQANSSTVIYKNAYSVGAIREKGFLTFGFPKIEDSKGKTYTFTLTSLNGDKTNSLDLHKEEDFFVSKYVYPGKSIKSPNAFLSLFAKRIKMLFLNTEALLVSSIYFLPFFFYITLIGFSKTFKSKLGSLTLSLIVLSIIFIQGEYAGIVLGLFGLWVIAVIKDKVSYKYTLCASLGFFLFAGLFVLFPKTTFITSSSMWGYLLLTVGFIQLLLHEKIVDIKKNFTLKISRIFPIRARKNTKIIHYIIKEEDKSFFTKHKLSTHIFFLIFSLVMLSPVLLDPHVVHANDLNGTDLYQIYFRSAVRTYHAIPQWNPYMQQGIPLVADPMYAMYNPLMSIPIIFMPSYDSAIKVIYLLSFFIACESMFLLTKTFTKSADISVFIALMYATSGYSAARLVAGHIESFVPYAVIPFLVLVLYKLITKKNLFWSGLCALIFTYILFSGSMYFLLYGFYCLLGLLLYTFFKDKKAAFFICISIILFFLFSSVKIFPILELQHLLGKTREPYLGSQTIISMIRYLFVPSDIPFALLHLTPFLSSAWSELEKISFIGIFPLFGLLWMLSNFRKIKPQGKSFLVILFVVAMLLLMPEWKLNPIHWLITAVTPLQFFRVPSRAFAFLIVIILVLFGIFSRILMSNRKYGRYVILMLFANLFSTVIFFELLLIHPAAIAYPIFNAKLSLYEKIFFWLEQHNKEDTYVLAENWPNEVPEDVAFYHNQRLLNTNYGFVLKDSPAAHFANVQRPSPFDYAAKYKDIQPGFFIAPHDQVKNIPPYAIKVYKVEDTAVYQLPNGRPFAVAEDSHGVKRPVGATVGLDSFTIRTYSKGSEVLSLAEMAYPGWTVAVDGKKVTPLSNRFLEVKAHPGYHTYIFSFHSLPFQLGSLITLVSLFLWAVYSSFFLRKHYKKN